MGCGSGGSSKSNGGGVEGYLYIGHMGDCKSDMNGTEYTRFNPKTGKISGEWLTNKESSSFLSTGQEMALFIREFNTSSGSS